MLTKIEENSYAKIIYDKPELKPDAGLFQRLIYPFKLKTYTDSIVKPMIKKMRITSPTFFEMCEFSDFIRIIEKVFFYSNRVRKATDNYPKCTKLLSDSPIDGSGDKRIMYLSMENEEITVRFTMYRKFNVELDRDQDWITEEITHDSSKGLRIVFAIVDREYVEMGTMHDYVMASNINKILQNAMADLFWEYYNKL